KHKRKTSKCQTFCARINISGLEGIGRRSYLERACKDNLGLNLGPYFRFDETIDLDDLYLWTLDETSDLGTRENMASEIRTFSSQPQSVKIEEIINRLKILCSDNCVPCFVDFGGFLDDLGQYKEPYVELLNAFALLDEDYYLALIHRRSPFVDDLPFAPKILRQKVQPLQKEEMTLLCQQLFRLNRRKINMASIEEIVTYMGGHPLAAYFTLSYVVDYGLQALVADKSILVDFNAKKFTRYIGGLTFSDTEWFVLQYLASEQVLPLSIIGVVADLRPEDLAPLLRNLIDHSLVLVMDDNYTISPPIRDAIHRVRGFIDAETYQEIRRRITETFWSNDKAAPQIEVVDATLHAVARSGSADLSPYQDLTRTSIVHRLARECYIRREWEPALEYATRAESMDPSRREVKIISFKSLVQLEKWDQAEIKLNEIQRSGNRLSFYLKGFMLRRRRQFQQAISCFELALKSGDKSHSVYRDYADCLHRCSRYKDALENVEIVLKRDPENIFALDLAIRICSDMEDTTKAEYFLAELEQHDINGRFIHHRRAKVLTEKRMWETALIEVEKACTTGFSTFEAFAQKVDTLIEMTRFEDAGLALNILERRFRGQRRDVQKGLRCKLLIRQGNWREAKSIWDNLDDKTLGVHLGLLQRILELKGSDALVPLAERTQAKDEAEKLKAKLQKIRIPISHDYEEEDQLL
ncbi:MAG: tetratricopeptide repeat protein, partial [Nitrospinota bacterium]